MRREEIELYMRFRDEIDEIISGIQGKKTKNADFHDYDLSKSDLEALIAEIAKPDCILTELCLNGTGTGEFTHKCCKLGNADNNALWQSLLGALKTNTSLTKINILNHGLSIDQRQQLDAALEGKPSREKPPTLKF